MVVHRGGGGKVNVRLLITLVVVAVVTGVALVVTSGMWRGILSEKALAAGQTAWEEQDWPAAVKGFRQYLGRHPDNRGVLKLYAESLLAIRPPDRSTVAGAIAAYRRILQLDPGDRDISERLATLYTAIENYGELATLAKVRLEQEPNDIKAPLWLAHALSRLNKRAEAQQTLETFLRQAGGSVRQTPRVRAGLCADEQPCSRREYSQAPGGDEGGSGLFAPGGRRRTGGDPAADTLRLAKQGRGVCPRFRRGPRQSGPVSPAVGGCP